MVKPGLLDYVVLNSIQMFLSVVHVVLEGAVTVVTVVTLPHNAASGSVVTIEQHIVS